MDINRVGLKAAPIGSIKVQGVKIRRYSLDQKLLDRMVSLAMSYRVEEERREHEPGEYKYAAKGF